MIDSSMNQENFQSSSTAPVYTSSTDKMSKKYEKPNEEKTSSPTLSSSLKEQKHSFEYNLPPIKFHINMDQQTSSSLNKSKKIVQTEVSPATRGKKRAILFSFGFYKNIKILSINLKILKNSKFFEHEKVERK